MNKRFLLLLCCLCFVNIGGLMAEESANSLPDPLAFQAPSVTALLASEMSDANATSSDDWSDKEAKRKKYGGYTPLRDLELTSVPLIAFGFSAKANKKNFRAARNNFIPSYKNGMDDYIQFAPAVTAYALNLCGYEGRSSFSRLFWSSGFSFAFMGIFVNGIKYTAKEMRPDGSTANSFPSGHTATAFTCATIMHKEYGLTRSPWFSVGAYSISTLTGIMRTLNNRHWISDILVGAGIGVISTDLGYMMADLWLKDKGINRQIREGNYDLKQNPSFFRFSLGMQHISDFQLPTNCTYNTMARLWDEAGAPELWDDYYSINRHGNPFHIPDDFNVKESERTYTKYANGAAFYRSPKIRVGTGTSVSADGAYYLTDYFGIGARARITTAPVYAQGLAAYDDRGNYVQGSNSASDVWALADWAAGFYGTLPLGTRHAVGGKVLFGHRYYGKLDLSGVYDMAGTVVIKGKEEPYNVTLYGDNLKVDATDSDIVTAGINYTYSMGNGVAISAFCDYDYSRAPFTVEYQPYNTDAIKSITSHAEFSYYQKVQSLTIGASMVVLF